MIALLFPALPHLDGLGGHRDHGLHGGGAEAVLLERLDRSYRQPSGATDLVLQNGWASKKRPARGHRAKTKRTGNKQQMHETGDQTTGGPMNAPSVYKYPCCSVW